MCLSHCADIGGFHFSWVNTNRGLRSHNSEGMFNLVRNGQVSFQITCFIPYYPREIGGDWVHFILISGLSAHGISVSSRLRGW